MSEEKERVYVTGKIEGRDKTQVREYVESLGYQWSGTINEKLKYLVLGERAGPAKIEKAKTIGITMLSWEEFVALH